MLVWHIDFQPDIWDPQHRQCFCKAACRHCRGRQPTERIQRWRRRLPGTANVTAFTDDTTPSMRSWSGNRLNAPITEIKEQSGIISFMFKGGEDIFDKVVAERRHH